MKPGMKPMETESKLTAHATAFGAADAPASENQDAGEKWSSGQRKKLITTRAEVKWPRGMFEQDTMLDKRKLSHASFPATKYQLQRYLN